MKCCAVLGFFSVSPFADPSNEARSRSVSGCVSLCASSLNLSLLSGRELDEETDSLWFFLCGSYVPSHSSFTRQWPTIFEDRLSWRRKLIFQGVLRRSSRSRSGFFLGSPRFGCRQHWSHTRGTHERLLEGVMLDISGDDLGVVAWTS